MSTLPRFKGYQGLKCCLPFFSLDYYTLLTSVIIDAWIKYDTDKANKPRKFQNMRKNDFVLKCFIS